MITLVSIPQSGFLVVTPGASSGTGIRSLRFQSLSRDSWWSHSSMSTMLSHPRQSFNPSVGILGGHTREGDVVQAHEAAFQSLSRDSWWSHPIFWKLGDTKSIGFNPSVGILGGHTRGSAKGCEDTSRVSIPQSGFLVVTPAPRSPKNLSCSKFQSLSRDSWWSHKVTRP
jgi:hypothetical protein